MSDKRKTPKKPSIRPVSRQAAPKGVAALKATHCFPEVERRVRLGWSSSDLSRMIQDEYGELGHLSDKYLKKLIDNYRQEIPPAELAMTSGNSKVSRGAQRKMATGLNELEELEKLYEMQMKRIDIDVDNEKKINKLFPTTGREVFVAMKLLKQSADLKASLGIYKRQLGTVEVTAQGAIEVGQRYDEGIGQILAEPDSRRKVASMVDTLLKLGNRASIDAIYSSKVIDVEPSETATEEG